MAQKKCPLCGEKIENGVCVSCGFAMPDEEVIAAPYNYDPSDYNIEEEKRRAAVLEKEMYAMPEIKVADSGKVEMEDAYAGGNYINGSGAANVRDGQYGSLNSPQQGNYRASPYVNANPPAVNNGNPYANVNPAAGNNGNPYANVNPAAGNINANPYANNNPPPFDPQTRNNNAGGNPYANFNPTKNTGKRFGSNSFGKGNSEIVSDIVVGVFLSLAFPIAGFVFVPKLFKDFAQSRKPAALIAAFAILILSLIRFFIFMR